MIEKITFWVEVGKNKTFILGYACCMETHLAFFAHCNINSILEMAGTQTICPRSMISGTGFFKFD